MATMKTDSPVNYVHEVPGHCDRVLWRGSYYHLENMRPAPETNDGLSKVYDAFGIGSAVRNTQTLLANVENAKRRSDCLSAIEREFFTRTIRYEDGEEADEADECALGWGAEPAEYVEQFRAALTERADLKTSAPHPDTESLNFIAAEYLHLIPFEMPTGQGDADVGWKVLQSQQGKGDVEIACVYSDDVRAAIDAARHAPDVNGEPR